MTTEDGSARRSAITGARVARDRFEPGAAARRSELCFFGGRSAEEAAATLGVLTATAGRDFRSARVLLAHELGAA
jgi:hypothetical protein